MARQLKEKVSISLDGDVIEAIRDLAEADDRAFSAYINRTLRRYIAHKDEVNKLMDKLDQEN